MFNPAKMRRLLAPNLLIACAVLASLLSPHVAQANDTRAPKLATGVARVPDISVVASTDEVVVIPQNVLNAVVWYALSTRGAITQTVTFEQTDRVTSAADDGSMPTKQLAIPA